MTPWKIGFATTLVSIAAAAGNAQLPSVARATITADTRRAVVDSVSNSLRRNYVWPDTAVRMSDYIERRLRDGAYDAIPDPQQFASALTRDLRTVYNDVHLSVVYDASRLSVGAAQSAEDRERAQASLRDFARKQNFGFKKIDILPGNIGYVALDRFFDINDESKSTVNAVFSVVRNSSALIIDLRNNGGGSPDMVLEICNYLFPVRTHIADTFERRANKTTEYWTVPEDRFRALFSVPVYVLVGKRTFSAGEGFAYALQSQRRATIIGQTTGGGAHLVTGNDVGHGFSANVPYARALDPVTKTNWEAVGVRPEIMIGADSAVDAAVLQYYQLTISRSTDSNEVRSVRWSRDMLQAKLHAASVDTAQLRDLTGDYEKRRITLENGALYFTGANGNKTRLIPMSPTVMRMENTEDMKLEFQRDRAGRAFAMLVTFSDGFTSTYTKKP